MRSSFPKGSLYVTDVGMTGVNYGVIGGEIRQGIRKFLTRAFRKPSCPNRSGPLQFNAVFLDLEQRSNDQHLRIRPEAPVISCADMSEP
ncbi:MAG: YmdB family metallophosphoesterase [Bacillus subtilis]|nr:YmdB family metallophosphoesterase [Bacillus subtilis]